MEMEKIRVVLVDDHVLFLNGLKLLLDTYDNIEIVGEANDGKQYIELAQNINHDIVLMDINMPVMHGVDATKKINELKKNVKVIALSMFGEEEYYYKMIDAGVSGFLLKNSDISELTNAIKMVHEGGKYFSQELLYNVVKNIKKTEEIVDAQSLLSEREIEILFHVCKGLSNTEIAENLNISKRTVDKHRANLLEKTKSKNTVALVMFAVKNKLISL
jgi:DNA-binding NarL/FixJ family response regulator